MHAKPARYLVLIDAGGSMVARLFDAERRHITDVDASSEEVAVMTQGLAPKGSAAVADWVRALAGHSASERAAAEIYELDV